MTQKIRGVLSPVITPFTEDLRPHRVRYLRHCRWLVAQGVGLAVFGTNSEANSLAVSEKRELLDFLLDAGLPASRMMPGTGSCSLTDAVELTRHALARGCESVLMLPPFYYKGVADDGLFAYFSEVIQQVASPTLKIYLYHIPPVSQVPINHRLIERLLKAYPGNIAGVKDSSGDWNHTRALLKDFQPHGFDVFAGSETFLLQTMQHGGAGCISATANVNPAAILDLFLNWEAPDAGARQAELDQVRAEFSKFSMIPALKSAIAVFQKEPAWARVRPPLVPLSGDQARTLEGALRRMHFELGAFEEAA